ncbi:MAG: glycosyltransferase [Caldilineaceae bacterium]|nr:glycosyltransferase [Caldilineaceae bacterium]MBP8107653.1 glycosyltransferase [Caldilineaceae bacterium]MBP8123238.1 glycosyltransferase [Caldilineaceae bacterium]MBP9072763.1 glycosyltransferase [Caldilineaceae bacterium]
MGKIAILGAGIAGLSTGWLLKQRGIDFVILEKQSYAGGLARSFVWNGFHCDFAAHRLFTNDQETLQALLRLVPMGRHVRRSQIYMNGGWMRDPLDTIELGLNLPLRKQADLLRTFLGRNRSLPDDNFQNYVLRRYGRALYKLFFQPYTEKLFGIPGDEISVLWAQQKVRLANPLDNYRKSTKNKFSYFYYPIRGGYGAIVDRLYGEIQDHVMLDTQVRGLTLGNDRIDGVRYVQNGEEHALAVDSVISTLPLTLTGRMLDHPIPLSYRKVDAVYLHINKPVLSDNHWIYFMDGDVCVNRMVEFKNMSPVETPSETTVICAEVTQEHDNVIQRVIDDLARTGLLDPKDVLDSMVLREEYAYPIYRSAYDQILTEAEAAFSRYGNLYVVGRAAEFRHREVDDNFSAAIETIERLAGPLPTTTVPVEKEATMPASSSTSLGVPVAAPLVYAVVLAWNNYDDTHECIASVGETHYPNQKIVLVDNGSNDGTPARIRAAFPDVHVIENGRNLGVPMGYNVGFSYALQQGAAYILELNNDTTVDPNMVGLLVDKAESDPDAGIIMPKVLFYGSQDEVWSSGGRYRRFPPAILFKDRRPGMEDTLREIDYAPTCGVLISRRAFEMVGLFDPGYLFLFDDWDFSERVRAHGLHIWYLPEARMWHKVSRTTQPGSPLFWRTNGESTTRFYRRHGRPAWISVPVHVGFVIFREFVWKRNWKHLRSFLDGVRDGLRKPLTELPSAPSMDKTSFPHVPTTG